MATVGTGNIRRLEEAVINRIAAGEVIQRPANALKEMLENSLDAGSTSVQVTVKNGGLKLLQIRDNGSGMRKEDMIIVCERFTTSKLQKFEDLSSINTYGFRGEALASISHVAHVTITTKMEDSKCAYKGSYCDGKLLPSHPDTKPEPKPCAGNRGTQITVEDLFYNVPTRLKALKSQSEEYHRIADIIGKYSIHNTGISFTLKKYGESVADIKTNVNNTIKENISLIYGQSVARELLSVSCEDRKLGFKMTGFITSANYSIKKLTHILFINNRLVNSTSLRKAIEVVYSSYLPKNTHPFVYMSIEIAACNIDVNVHPTKHEVLFLHEDLITAAIQKTVEDCLLGCNSSRTYYTQALLPGATIPVSLDEFTTSKTDTGKMYDHQMVRTDSREIKLDAFIIPQPGKESNGGRDEDGIVEMGGACKRNLPHPSPAQHRKKSHCPVRLDSVKNLISELNKKQHKDLSVLFNDHKFVGCVDQTRALVQYQTKLYLVNVTNITKQLFYQLLLMDFANFNIIRLNPPPLLYDLAIIGLESPQSGWSEAEDGSKELLAKNVVSFLKTKSAMLKDYWSFEIDEDGRLLSIPLLLEGYTPNVDRLPLLILRLSTEVNWEEEERCFNTLANEYAMFYSVQYDPYLLDNANKEMSNTNPSSNSNSESGLMKRFPWRWIIEHVVFSAMRSEFVPQKEMAEDGTVLQIADLKDLYKVFERC